MAFGWVARRGGIVPALRIEARQKSIGKGGAVTGGDRVNLLSTNARSMTFNKDVFVEHRGM